MARTGMLTAAYALALAFSGCAGPNNTGRASSSTATVLPARVRSLEARDEPAVVVLPASRVDAVARTANAALGAGDVHYDLAMTTPVTPAISTTFEEWLRSYLITVATRMGHIERARELYFRAASADAERVLAHVRLGDLYDALAAGLATPYLPPIVSSGSSPNDAALAQQVLEESVRDLLTREAMGYFCAALREYRAALAVDPQEPRAFDQRVRYGATFAAACRHAPLPSMP